ncbi:hypothetical protein [Rhizobium daejeonense]|nr:hypothetical protein [Rhizobium daejeonense]
MQGLIYTVNPDGTLQRMAPSAPESEDRMQSLVAKYPELISDGDGELLLIKREQTILDSEQGAGRWSVDHLFVTRTAVPVLVELKRAVDPRLRREVIGQMLEYAANATAYWQPGKIADSFAMTASQEGADPDKTLADFIGEQDPASFWSQVDANFRAGQVKLVFVADEVSRELARIVEFLNDQMRADVRAVELRWYTSALGHITLSPRIIGETERTASAKRLSQSPGPIATTEWLETHIRPLGPDFERGAFQFLKAIDKWRARAEISNTHASLYVIATDSNERPIYPLHLWATKGEVSFSLKWLFNKPAFADEGIRRELYDQLVEIVGPLSTGNLAGLPSFLVKQLASEDLSEKFTDWGARLIERMKNGASMGA